jgi:protein-tyrosine phosphatase
MPDNLFWIRASSSGRLAVAPRPRGGDWLADDIATWRRMGVDVVVSLLTPEEVYAFELELEQEVCRVYGIKFFSLRIVDRNVPSNPEEFSELVKTLSSHLQQGKTVAIHCRQGIGRSGLIAIALLVQEGSQIDEAIRIVTADRGLPVPETQEQLDWVNNILPRQE